MNGLANATANGERASSCVFTIHPMTRVAPRASNRWLMVRQRDFICMKRYAAAVTADAPGMPEEMPQLPFRDAFATHLLEAGHDIPTARSCWATAM